MSESVAKPELNNEHRYMALLALTSQQLPESHFSDVQGGDRNQDSVKPDAMFERLDADPAALEDFLRRHRPQNALAERPESLGASLIKRTVAWFADLFAQPAVRYATAFGVTAVAVLLVLQSTSQPDVQTVRAEVERSYATVALDAQRSPLNALVLPWERPPSAVGFVPNAASDSPAGTEFARGLLTGRDRLAVRSGTGGVSPRINSQSNTQSAYAVLGEWNILLWAASESGQPQSAEFWNAQRQVVDALAAIDYDDAAVSTRIESHLAAVRDMLTALSNGDNPARNARALADELLLFREQLGPHQPPP